ncbi:Uncharacterized protein FWK35_00000949 [Aphis craccivora]|uniref:Uncharacterized protein n=1 Tax=Aphis craccivora TaxID=307492 RepID=A0A6G0ZJC6_APHCR|nr:Uncharacterized protein FWK35_00000949 [Aphis craccivora]
MVEAHTTMLKSGVKWIPLCCTLMTLIRVISIAIFEGKFIENLVLNFLTLDISTKNFMIFQLQNYLQMFAILTYFQNNILVIFIFYLNY